MKTKREITPEKEQQQNEALALYNSVMNGYQASRLYRAATEGRTNKYANALIDEALAICGDPYYVITDRKWHPKAQAWLDLFRTRIQDKQELEQKIEQVKKDTEIIEAISSLHGSVKNWVEKEYNAGVNPELSAWVLVTMGMAQSTANLLIHAYTTEYLDRVMNFD